ncbi:Uncharacterized protein HZ326_4388 [Fusarium oxysporum f. sp. albedinis]|nr:Uncharacterized protein HZ326_4388 [Fusarium oxysporum f. sp. albedinis]
MRVPRNVKSGRATQQGHIRDCDFLITQSVLAAQNIAVNRQSSNLARPDHLSYRGSKDPESLARLNLLFSPSPANGDTFWITP